LLSFIIAAPYDMKILILLERLYERIVHVNMEYYDYTMFYAKFYNEIFYSISLPSDMTRLVMEYIYDMYRPCGYAMRMGNIELVKLAVDLVVSPFINYNEEWCQPNDILNDAIRYGHHHIVRWLLFDDGTNIWEDEPRDIYFNHGENHEPICILAAKHDDIEILEFIGRNGLKMTKEIMNELSPSAAQFVKYRWWYALDDNPYRFYSPYW